jgi:hypothetical protein
MAGVVDGVGIAVNALLDAAAGTAGVAAFFLFFFFLAAAEGTIGGRARGMIMTLIRALWCGCPELFLRQRGQSHPPHSSG